MLRERTNKRPTAKRLLGLPFRVLGAMTNACRRSAHEGRYRRRYECDAGGARRKVRPSASSTTFHREREYHWQFTRDIVDSTLHVAHPANWIVLDWLSISMTREATAVQKGTLHKGGSNCYLALAARALGGGEATPWRSFEQFRSFLAWM